jgi:hypothetical protein
MRHLRAILGITLLLIVAVISSAVSLTRAVQLGPDYRYADMVTDYEGRRLNDIRPLLPSFTTISYLNEQPYPDDPAAPSYYLAQYFLAPTIVVIDGSTQGRVLVDGQPDREPAVLSRRRLVLEYDAGNGVRLYRVEEP